MRWSFHPRPVAHFRGIISFVKWYQLVYVIIITQSKDLDHITGVNFWYNYILERGRANQIRKNRVPIKKHGIKKTEA